jgi:hypothetical protein
MPFVNNIVGARLFTRASLLLQRTVLIGIATGIIASCTSINERQPSHREDKRRAEAALVLQQRVMRFADEYTGRVVEVTTRYQLSASTPEDRLIVQEWKVEQANAAYTIAGGPNAVTNALDMVVLATLSHMVIEDVWTTTSHAARVRPVAEQYAKLEQESWGLLRGQLSDSQVAQVHDLITRWRQQNPQIRAVGFIHFTDFAQSLGEPVTEEAEDPQNLFSLLGIDPFTSLDPAVREVAQTRALAERAIFYMQRMPRLLRMQVQELLYQTTVLPEAKSVMADLDRASLVGSAADRLVKSLPEVLSEQREALVAQVMQELDSHRSGMTAATSDIRSTLQAGTDTANAVHGTLETWDDITARMARDRAERTRAGEHVHRFDIRDYTQMVQELNQATGQLNALTHQLDSSVPTLRATTKEMLNQLFLRLFLLVVACLLAALAYRALAMRFFRS